MPQPVGLPEREIIRTLAIIEANLEMTIPPVPLPQRQAILDKARLDMTVKP